MLVFFSAYYATAMYVQDWSVGANGCLYAGLNGGPGVQDGSFDPIPLRHSRRSA